MQHCYFAAPNTTLTKLQATVDSHRAAPQPASGAVRYVALVKKSYASVYSIAYVKDNRILFLYTCEVYQGKEDAELTNCQYFGNERDFGCGNVDPFRNDQGVKAFTFHEFKEYDQGRYLRWALSDLGLPQHLVLAPSEF